MKTSYFIGTTIILALVCFGFTSCSSEDDENGNEGTEEVSSDYLIKQKICLSDPSGESDVAYGYDSKGRVISENGHTYTYLEREIYVDTHLEYKLSNGLIVEDADGSTWPYDKNGYLIKEVDKYGEVATITWKNGNLVKYEGNTWSIELKYSDMTYPKGWMMYFHPLGIEADLEPSGAWGKMPKNLPTEVTEYQNGELNGTAHLEYTIENKRITMFKESWEDPKRGLSETIIYKIKY